MTPLESSVSDATIWSIILELSIIILDASFTLVYDVYSTGITYDDHQYVYSIGQTNNSPFKCSRNNSPWDWLHNFVYCCRKNQR